jgi:hypothetical protein
MKLMFVLISLAVVAILIARNKHPFNLDDLKDNEL